MLAVTGSAVTVGARASAHATGYRLYISSTRSDVYSVNLARAHKSATTRTPRMTVGGLAYTSKPYYYRVVALNGSKRRLDPVIHFVGLRPATPSGVHATSSSAGTYLSWSAAAVTGYTVEQSNTPDMRTAHRTYVIRGTCAQFTPYGLAKDHPYYFRVRAVNVSTLSAYSPVVHATAGATEQSLSVLTYNVLTATSAGTHEGGQVVPSWTSRRPGVASLIKQSDPDVVAVQEAAGWVGSPQGYGGSRQIDDLRRALGTYTLAATEVPPTRHGYFRTGNYLLYRSAAYRSVYNGGHWDLGEGHSAAYQILENRSTGARVLAVSVHLIVGKGLSYDKLRDAETKSVLRQARALASSHDVPVIYAGDFNSTVNSNHVVDAPALAMRAARINDAQLAAQTLSSARYNSSNQYVRTPPAFGQSIDYVFAPPGIGVRSRSLIIRLTHGKFVGVMPSDHNPIQAELTFPY